MLSEPIKRAFADYLNSKSLEVAPEEVPRIHVDEVASRVASFYEKIRNVVDYKEEHLLRKRFIDRVLRRRLILSSDEDISESLVKEIVRAGHLKNDTVSENKIAETQKIIDSLRCLHAHLPQLDSKESEDISEMLHAVTANAIEDKLFPPSKDSMLADLMFAAIKKDLVVRGQNLTEEEINAQLFIAIQKALLLADSEQIRYRLIKFTYPNWDNMSADECRKVASELTALKADMERIMASSAAPYFFKICNRYNTVFYIIGDIVSQMMSYEDLEKAISEPEKLEREVKLAYERRFKRARKKLNRMAFLSVVSFFISKVAIALAVEIPIEMSLSHSFSVINTLINIAFPPFLMLLIVASVRMPDRGNINLVLEGVKNVLYEGRSGKYIVNSPKRKTIGIQAVVRTVYFASFVVTFYLLVKLLIWLDFSVANIIIFVFFVSLVSAAGLKIHNRSRELSLDAREGGFLSFLFDLFAMPLVVIGRWIIDKLARFNPLVIAINLIIEAPFQVFVEFLENFRSFIKSKKEEVL